MATKPGDGERRAAAGYRPQYLAGASLILKALEQGDLEWIRIADPDAGRVDDIQIAITGRIDAYQVKWTQYGGTLTLNDLTSSSNEEAALVNQLSQGWKKLKAKYPHHRIVVHLATNQIPSVSSSATMPETENKPEPYHLSAFIEQAWLPASRDGSIVKSAWEPVWSSLQDSAKLSDHEFADFVQDCSLDFNFQYDESPEIIAIHNLLFATAASPERIIQLDRNELLTRLGWGQRYEFRNLHEFPAPRYLYRPIQSTVKALNEKLESIAGGYMGVFGPPGSGKSTLLTQTLRTLPVRLIRYYAYVPDAQDPSILRGESINFFHDMTLRLQQIGMGRHKRPALTDRAALINLFHEQLQALGEDHLAKGTRTVILIDGLDHISREQHPERSLLSDLPLPNAIPSGVYLIVGSQTKALTNLPLDVHHSLSQDDRTIIIGKLDPTDVYAIIQDTLPILEQEQRQRIYHISDGHPLALIYLLNSLIQAGTPEEYNAILENSLPYQGDIERQYHAHWRRIEEDPKLTYLMGLLARIRGPISMRWVAQWVEQSLLRKLSSVFAQYFSSDSQGRWEFFHNSFRIFLEAKTATPLPGQTVEEINRQYHLELAQHYETAEPPWKWETLYHLYKAGNLEQVIETAQYRWFRTQVEALRPIDAIETDVRLAAKAAGELIDPLALMRYTLLGASLQQRAKTLEDTRLPHLLIEVGKLDLVTDHIKDGTRLRISDEKALSLSAHLHNAGLKQDALRIFELAEPLEYLSGRPIPANNTRPQNLSDLLSAWVRSASLFRTPVEVIEIVRRIQAEPDFHDRDKDLYQVSLNLQNLLLYQGALACCKRDNWAGWQSFLESLDEQRDQEIRYFVLLRTVEYLYATGQIEHAREKLKIFLGIELPFSFGTGRQPIANCLSVAEMVLFLGIENAKIIAEEWLNKIGPIPLTDPGVSGEKTVPLYQLQYQFARIRFVLNDTLTPSQLLQASEDATSWSEYERDEVKSARRQLNSIIFHLAKIWAEGHLGHYYNSSTFLNKTKGILDLVEAGWSSESPTFRLEVMGTKGGITKYIVGCSAKHGKETLIALKDEFNLRWTDRSNNWEVGTQREVVMAFLDQGVEQRWVKDHLERIESTMLHNLDLYTRVEQCEKQTEAWLAIGEKEFALSTLHQLVKSSRGIYHDEDYQLAQWARWLRKTNFLESLKSDERIRTFLRQVASVEGNASGVGDAFEIILQALFDLSPHKAVQLYKILLERKSITHEEGITNLLIAALEAESPAIGEIIWITSELVLPLVRGSSSYLLKQLIIKANSLLDQPSVIQLSQHFVNRIRIDALSDQRANWFEGICDGLTSVGLDPSLAGIQPIDLVQPVGESSSSLDRNLYLKTGQQMSLQEALGAINSIEDLQGHLDAEDRKRNNYFEWHRVAQHLIGRISSSEDLWKICDLIEGRIDSTSRETYLAEVFTSLSRRFHELDQATNTEQAITKALALTKPHGWAVNWDGGVKYKAMRQMLTLLGEAAREKLVRLYAQDLSERFRNAEQILMYGKDLVEILFADIPYTKIWPDIEEYLDELFTGIMGDPIPELEAIWDIPLQPSIPDAPDYALAELLMLYLGFPSYFVSGKAIRACSEAVLAGNPTVEMALKGALGKHDELVTQSLVVLEVASLQKAQAIFSFRDQIQMLQKSPNIIIRLIATTITNNLLGQSLPLPRVERSISAIYSIELPNMALHKTEYSLHQDTNPVLLNDPALVLSPLDFEARILARASNLSENNILYRAAQKLHELQPYRTWLVNGGQLEPDKLSLFLEKIDLRFSHNKPKISPARNAIAHVAAELYDAGYIQESDWLALNTIFRNYDPNLYFLEPEPRPTCIAKIGGLDYSHEPYIKVPEDWSTTSEQSVSLLSKRSSDGRIILGEWTRLKRLDEDWPMEERISLMRVTNSSMFWDEIDPTTEEVPFVWVKGAQITDYFEITNDFPSTELVIAHNGYEFQTDGANWLGFNPRIGFEMGWQLSRQGLFRWTNQENLVVVESVWWQDGPMDLFSRHDRVEVGNGWLVLITEEGYQEICQRFSTLTRGGVVKRYLGWHGTDGEGRAVSLLDI